MWWGDNSNANSGGGAADEKRSKDLVKRFEVLQEPFLDDLTPNIIHKYLVKLSYYDYGKYAGIVVGAATFVGLRKFGFRRFNNERYFQKSPFMAPGPVKLQKSPFMAPGPAKSPPNAKVPGSSLVRLMSAGIFLFEFSSSLLVARNVELCNVNAVVNLFMCPIGPGGEHDAACDRYCATIVDEMEHLRQQDDTSARLLDDPKGYKIRYFVDHVALCQRRLDYQNWMRQVKGLPADSPVEIAETGVPIPKGFQLPSISNASSNSNSNNNNNNNEGTRWAADLVRDQEEGDSK